LAFSNGSRSAGSVWSHQTSALSSSWAKTGAGAATVDRAAIAIAAVEEKKRRRRALSRTDCIMLLPSCFDARFGVFKKRLNEFIF